MIFSKIPAVIIWALFMMGCSDYDRHLAVPSETTNGIQISLTGLQLTAKSGSPKAVYIYDVSYHPIFTTGFADTLQVSAQYELQYSLPESGKYNLFIYNPALDSGYYMESIIVHPDSNYLIYKDLCRVGALKGHTRSAITGAAVYIPGSSLGSWLGPLGEYELNAIPPGNYTVVGEQIIRARNLGEKILDGRQTITVSEGDTLTLNFN